MGLIREPKDVDFFVESRQLTDEERKKISAYIQSQKAKREKRSSKSIDKNTSRKQVSA